MLIEYKCTMYTYMSIEVCILFIIYNNTITEHRWLRYLINTECRVIDNY